MSTEIEYRAVLRDVAQVVIGELVSEDDDVVVLKKPAILYVQAQGQSINLQFVPLELVSLQPPISLKVLCREGEALDFEIPFSKKELLVTKLPLNDEIFKGYKESQNPSKIVTPSNNGGLVGPNGELLEDSPPKVQDLF